MEKLELEQYSKHVDERIQAWRQSPDGKATDWFLTLFLKGMIDAAAAVALVVALLAMWWGAEALCRALL